MNFSLSNVKREEKIVCEFDKSINDIINVKKTQINKILSGIKNQQYSVFYQKNME